MQYGFLGKVENLKFLAGYRLCNLADICTLWAPSSFLMCVNSYLQWYSWVIMSNVIAIQMEIQKVNCQKQYFEHTIAELEKGLRDAIASADTTDRDAKYVLCVCWDFDTVRVTVTWISVRKCIIKAYWSCYYATFCLLKAIQMKTRTVLTLWWLLDVPHCSLLCVACSA